ncbi:MAG: HAD-IA family hydrolase [Bacteroidales bacterium]|nr:HAD-IA family hydrolase [Bacteroidales bacterium]
MQKTTLLFDFDLTLADSSQGIFKCISYALNKMAYKNIDYETIKLTIGHSLKETFRILTGNSNHEKATQFTTLFVEKADEIMNDNTVIFPEVFELLPKIKELGFKTGIVSTKYGYRIQGVLKRDGLSPYFDIIVGGDDVKNHKPNPEGLLLAINKLNVEKNEVLYIGDSMVDAEAAKLGEVDFVAVLTGTVTKEMFFEKKYQQTISNLHDLTEYIRINFS